MNSKFLCHSTEDIVTAFPWIPNSLQCWSTLMNKVIFQSIYFLVTGFALRTQTAPESEQNKWAVQIGSYSDVIPRFQGVLLAVRSIWGKQCCEPRQNLCFTFRLHGPICEFASMFNKIRSLSLRICDWRQTLCIGWLIVGDGVSCCRKGHAGSIAARGHCGHA